MKRSTERTGNEIIIKQEEEAINNLPPKVDIIATSVVTGVVATVIVQSGTGIISKLAKNPWVMLSLGVATGYFALKYRKEIAALSNQAAEQGKDFAQRQKQGLKDLLAATLESTEKPTIADMHSNEPD